MKKISKLHQRLQKTPSSKWVSATPKSAMPEAVDIDKEDKGPDGPKKRVFFMSREAVRSYRFKENDVLVSISDTGTEPPVLAFQPKDMVAVAFHDYVTALEQEQFGWRWIQLEDAEKIAQFVLKHTDVQNIIVHCNYGQSRSKAAAVAIGQMTGRSILHADAFGRIVRYNKDDHSFNDRVYQAILMAYMGLED